MHFTYSFMFPANSAERVMVAFSVLIRPKMQGNRTGDGSSPEIECLQNLGKVAYFVFGLQTQTRVAAACQGFDVAPPARCVFGRSGLYRLVDLMWSEAFHSDGDRLTDSMPSQKFFLDPPLPWHRHRASAFN